MEVTTVEDEKIEINYERPGEIIHNYKNKKIKGQTLENYFQRFKLQPNTYVISFKLDIFELLKQYIKDDKMFRQSIEYLMKISSSSECTFEKLKNEKEIVFSALTS